ncbi:MAG: NuoM family protein, partial [Chloroflexota bacterium]
MILVWLLIVLGAAGGLAVLSERWGRDWPRWVTLGGVAIDFVIGLAIWINSEIHPAHGRWLINLDVNWIPALGIHFHLALDGLSLLLIMLTFALGIVAVLASWHDITAGIGFFHLTLCWLLAAIIGVFLALDLFLFYFSWELMLVPMFLMILIWGHERRRYAAIKFFLFTQISGLLMLISILALYFFHHAATGVYTFEYAQLLNTPLPAGAATLIMLGFFAAFMVKLPVFPFHTWLPDAHTEASTAGSLVLAGLMLKTGAYGMLRFVLPLFPAAAHELAPYAMVLAVIDIIYGGVLAYAQSDI